jgi:DNA-binding NarL/FixJ family response regulator
MSVRCLVADDHEVVRSGLTSMFDGTAIEVVGEASTGEETVRMARELNPDVISLDIRMDNGDGLAALEQLRAEMPNSKVVVFSTFDNPTYVARAHALGAKDYILKGTSKKDLVESLQAVAEGRDPPRFGQMQRIAGQMATRQRQPDSEIPLTQRETQVLRHLALGLSNKEIAQSLEISIETVKEHVQHLLRKMGVNDRTQAAVWAVRKGLV